MIRLRALRCGESQSPVQPDGQYHGSAVMSGKPCELFVRMLMPGAMPSGRSRAGDWNATTSGRTARSAIAGRRLRQRCQHRPPALRSSRRFWRSRTAQDSDGAWYDTRGGSLRRSLGCQGSAKQVPPSSGKLVHCACRRRRAGSASETCPREGSATCGDEVICPSSTIAL